ncbi:MAG: hypothetical protein ACPHCI_04800 [Solirubrobacterales bacterium]
MIEPANVVVSFWDDQIADSDRQAIFLLLLGFLGSFLFIRTSARLGRSTTWWPGSVVTDDGVHLHHLVWGICTMMAAGVLGFALHEQSPWFETFAVLFGIGMGLTIDEFALWIYLKDVYWAEEGRKSIDAAVYAAALIGLLLLGFNPFEGDDNTVAVLITASLIAIFSGICFMKERVTHGLIGIFIPILSIYGAVRLAKPKSLWAKKFYADKRPKKQRRSEARYAKLRTHRLKDRLRDLLGGKTNEELSIEGNPPERISTADDDVPPDSTND